MLVAYSDELGIVTVQMDEHTDYNLMEIRHTLPIPMAKIIICQYHS